MKYAICNMNLKVITIIGMIIIITGIVAGAIFFLNGKVSINGTWKNLSINLNGKQNTEMKMMQDTGIIKPELLNLLGENGNGGINGLANTRWEIRNSSGTEVAGIDHLGSLALIGNISATLNITTSNFFVGNGTYITGLLFAPNTTAGIQALINNTNLNLASLNVTNNVSLGNTCTVWVNATGSTYGSICGNGTSLVLKVS